MCRMPRRDVGMDPRSFLTDTSRSSNAASNNGRNVSGSFSAALTMASKIQSMTWSCQACAAFWVSLWMIIAYFLGFSPASLCCHWRTPTATTKVMMARRITDSVRAVKHAVPTDAPLVRPAERVLFQSRHFDNQFLARIGLVERSEIVVPADIAIMDR